jgi:hypothetical protein
MRRCVDCKVEKLLVEFPKNRTCYLGYGYNCRVCNSARACAWAKENRKRVQKNQTAWRLENKEHVAKKRRAWYAENASDILAKARVRRSTPEAKERERWKLVRYLYGLSKSEWFSIFEAQGRRCAICPRTEPATKHWWHTDHDHRTGKVRGILCHNCNNMLGRAADSVETLTSGIRYLEKYK